MGAKRIPKPGVRATRRVKRRPTKTRLYHPGPPIDDEATLGAAAERLRAKDPELVERLIALGGPPPLRRREAGFAGLAAIIVAQQVSTASASAIFGRLQACHRSARGGRDRQGDRRGLARLRIVQRQNPRFAGACPRDRRGRPRSQGPRRSGRRGRPQGAGRGEGDRSVDGGHFPPVLPWPSGRLPCR